MQGGSPLAGIAGSRVSIAGPFAPGVTQVPVAFRDRELALPTGRSTQRFPLPLEQRRRRRAEAERHDARESRRRRPCARRRSAGMPYLVAIGNGLPAGDAADGDAARPAASVSRSPSTGTGVAVGLVVVGRVGSAIDAAPEEAHGAGSSRRGARRGLSALAALDEQARAGHDRPAGACRQARRSFSRARARLSASSMRRAISPAATRGSPRDDRLRSRRARHQSHVTTAAAARCTTCRFTCHAGEVVGAARSQRRRQVHAARDRLDAADADSGPGSLRRAHGGMPAVPRCAAASAGSGTTCSSIRS